MANRDNRPVTETTGGYTLTALSTRPNRLVVRAERFAGLKFDTLNSKPIMPGEVAEALAELIKEKLGEAPFNVADERITVERVEATGNPREGVAEITIEPGSSTLLPDEMLTVADLVFKALRDFKLDGTGDSLCAKLKVLRPPGYHSPLGGEDVYLTGNDANLIWDDDEEQSKHRDLYEDDEPSNDALIELDDPTGDAEKLAKVVDGFLPQRLDHFGMVPAIAESEDTEARATSIRREVMERIENVIATRLMRDPKADAQQLRKGMVRDIASILGEHLNLTLDDETQEQFFKALDTAGATSHTMHVLKETPKELNTKEKKFVRRLKEVHTEGTLPNIGKVEDRAPLDLDDPLRNDPRRKYSVDAIEESDRLAREIADALLPDEWVISQLTGRNGTDPSGGIWRK